VNAPSLPAAILEAYFEEVLQRVWVQASVERSFRLGAFLVRTISPQAEMLRSMTRALNHVETSPGGTPDVTILLWGGEPVPPSPFLIYERVFGAEAAKALRTAPLSAHGQYAVFNSPNIRTSLHVSPNVLRLTDVRRGLALEWHAEPNPLPYYTRAEPFRQVFSWMLNRPGWVITHGGAVGVAQGGVLFMGDSGIGKTTAALSCIGSSLSYAGDDYCLIDIESNTAYSLYHAAKLRGNIDTGRFPHLQRLIDNPVRQSHEKALVFAGELSPSPIIRSFPLRALLTPRRVPLTQTPRLIPIRPGEALAAIAPSTLAEQPGGREAALPALIRLTQALPAYIIEVNEEIQRIPLLVEELLHDQGWM
jgi:hypothetical protein